MNTKTITMMSNDNEFHASLERDHGGICLAGACSRLSARKEDDVRSAECKIRQPSFLPEQIWGSRSGIVALPDQQGPLGCIMQQGNLGKNRSQTCDQHRHQVNS